MLFVVYTMSHGICPVSYAMCFVSCILGPICYAKVPMYSIMSPFSCVGKSVRATPPKELHFCDTVLTKSSTYDTICFPLKCMPNFLYNLYV